MHSTQTMTHATRHAHGQQGQGQAQATHDGSRQLVVGGLQSRVTRQAILAYFRVFGDVDAVFMPMNDRCAAYSKGFAIVTLATPEDVGRVVRYSHYIHGRRVHVARAARHESKLANKEELIKKKVFFKWLPECIGRNRLKREFTKFGVVKECVVYQASKVNKGFGFVIFEKEESVRYLMKFKGSFFVSGYLIYIDKFKPNEYTKSEYGRCKREEKKSNYVGESMLQKKERSPKVQIRNKSNRLIEDKNHIWRNVLSKTRTSEIEHPLQHRFNTTASGNSFRLIYVINVMAHVLIRNQHNSLHRFRL